MNELVQKLQLIKTEKEKITPEVLKSGVTAFGIVGTNTSNSMDGVKLFETGEAMQADPTAKIGDLAIVYRDETANSTLDSRFNKVTFPQIVILDTAITSDIYLDYRATDGSYYSGQRSIN